MQYAHPFSCDARIRTSSRSRTSKSTLSSSLVAAWSRCDIARAKPAACASKSSLDWTVWVVIGDLLFRLGVASRYGPRGAGLRSNSMLGTWSTSAGLDLHLEVSGTRPQAALEAALRNAVRSGRLTPGTALPSSRALALDLGIARNTVAEAYGQLVAEGWLAARHGSRTWVAERAGALPTRAQPQTRVASRGARYDLRPGAPDLALFPRSAWLAAARRALMAAPAGDLGYASSRGLEVLRVAIAEYVARARGVITTPDRIVVCAGFTQGLELLSETLLDRGVEALAVEA